MLSRRTLIATGLSTAALGAAGYHLWPQLGAYRQEAARQRRRLEADPEIAVLVRFAALAPNGHNTQPWTFRAGEGGLTILPDFSRRTPVVDPDDHHLLVSLGCAAENLMIAARAVGRPGEIAIAGGDRPHIDIALARGRAVEDPLFAAIPHRQTTRSVYDGRPVSPGDLALLKSAALEEGISVRLFTAEADKEAVLEFVVEGNSAQIDDPAFVEELRSWIRFSSKGALDTRDSLFTACTGSPVVPAWLGGPLFSAFFTKKAENDKYAEHVRSSAGIAVFSGARADPEHWVGVGRSFERFALQATALGIRTAHVNQPVEVPSVRAQFARWLGTPEVRPDLVIRFGRAPAMPMSLRRPVAEVMV